MSETERAILDTFKRIIPDMTEKEQRRLLYFGEGMAFMKDREKGGKEDGRCTAHVR